MSITNLAKELRKLRIDRDERLLDMAAKLNISPAFLSAVESGRKAAPTDFAERVIARYDLSGANAKRLLLAAAAARTTFKITPRDPLARDTVALLARKLNTLSEDKLTEIKRLLEKEEDNDGSPI
ncbi:hypothetical protein BA190_23990 [Labrys sp. WJW]|uniref:helix-turn-helix domain-containing protein n=1 Tax=Labrys sp. WJW TaxID=1737983 RepID=UPI0008345435|nr:helix-turn-helix transcriptional regulator [Labrys sp. WJW]OCC02389.1 hypothetical protein BA190_23990 [Labrys sp. WJW]